MSKKKKKQSVPEIKKTVEDEDEVLYMFLDDTVDIGKEPLPVFRTEEEEREHRRWMKQVLRECTIRDK